MQRLNKKTGAKTPVHVQTKTDRQTVNLAQS